jgi:hypothetical protein
MAILKIIQPPVPMEVYDAVSAKVDTQGDPPDEATESGAAGNEIAESESACSTASAEDDAWQTATTNAAMASQTRGMRSRGVMRDPMVHDAPKAVPSGA